MKATAWLGSILLLGITLWSNQCSPLEILTSCFVLNSVFYITNEKLQ